ncbi:MAG TPA: SufD family Fe-S cluster assembly protein, partial [Flavobacteriaceae bacterium]|nr:SufD family Fe-S cluster assembly protein [Flavobacteriaceae bacterium]
TTGSVHTFALGGNIVRNNLEFYQHGSHSNSILKGITVLENREHVDHHTLVHHTQPNCESHQDYKGIFSDRSTGIFNGKILVDKIAQKLSAYQQNNNVVVDDRATVNSKPQLEIYADDVRCSHGCTIGQLPDESMFYLRTRGIPKKEAEAVLMFAFANTVLESVRIPALKEEVMRLIANKLDAEINIEI